MSKSRERNLAALVTRRQNEVGRTRVGAGSELRLSNSAKAPAKSN
jgi:hypothetical protein